MIIRLLPRPSILCFVAGNLSLFRLRANLLHREGRFLTFQFTTLGNSSFSSLNWIDFGRDLFCSLDYFNIQETQLSKSNLYFGHFCMFDYTAKLKNRFRIHLNVRSMSGSGSSWSPSPALSEKQMDRILAGEEDEHGGVIVEMSTEPMDLVTFTCLLKASMLHWKQQGKRGIWIKLPIELVNLIEAVVKEGFYYHHAEAKHLMLVHWIPETTNTLPANASHRVGIGAFVMNQNGQVLVVQEKSGKFQGSFLQESLMRQSHKSFFEKSDLFFMCMLQPLSFNIQIQEREIQAAQWMAFEEYADQDFVQKHDLLKYMVKICIAKRDGKYSGFSPVSTTTSFSNKQSNLYFNTNDLNH